MYASLTVTVEPESTAYTRSDFSPLVPLASTVTWMRSSLLPPVMPVAIEPNLTLVTLLPPYSSPTPWISTLVPRWPALGTSLDTAAVAR